MLDTIPRSQIDEALYLVMRTIYHYERSIISRYGLDYQQIYALQYLRRSQDARLTDISHELDLPMFATSRMIDRLAAKEFVKKGQNTKDRRNLQIHLEPKGEEVLRAVEQASFERIQKNCETLGPEEIAQIVELARNLHIILGTTGQVMK